MQELPPELEIELTKRVGVLAAAYPGAEVSKRTLQVYAQMLSDLPLDVLDASIEQCIAERRFFPSVSELRDVALTLTSSAGRRRTAAEAWGIVLAEVKRAGFYGRPAFDDSLVARAVEIMDWPRLCSGENHEADRAHFMRIYEQLATREVEDARLLPQAREMRALVDGLAGRKLIGAPPPAGDEGTEESA